MPEIEIKLTHPDPQVLLAVLNDRLIVDASDKNGQTIRMHAEYYDTADGALFAAGCGLRFRSENDRGVVTLKTQAKPTDATGLSVRGEFETEAASLARALPKICSLAPDYAELLTKHALDLTVTAAVTFTRLEYHADLGDATVAFSVDQGFFNGDPTQSFAEFEAELKSGSETRMTEVCRALAETYGLVPLADSKLKRALAAKH